MIDGNDGRIGIYEVSKEVEFLILKVKCIADSAK
jgi:hypothetical protein